MLNYLRQHCTSELLTYVFGNTNIESEISTNIIHIENCINKKNDNPQYVPLKICINPA